MIHSIKLKKLLYRNLVLLVIVPLLVLILLIMAIHSADIRKDVSDENQSLLNAVTGEVSANLRESLNDLMVVRDVVSNRSLLSADRKDPFLSIAVDNYPYFDSIRIVDRDGVVTSRAYRSGSADAVRGDVRVDQASLELVRQVLEQRQPRWSSATLAPADSPPTIAVAIPVGRQALLANLRLDYLNSITGKVEGDHHVFALVMDHEGRVIGKPRPGRIASVATYRELDIVRKAMRGTFGNYRFDVGGREYIGCIALVRDSGWMVMVAQDVGLAYTPIYHVGAFFVAGLLLCVLFVALAASRSVSRVLEPIQALCASTQSVADGQYQDFRPPYSIREIDLLGDNFRTMVNAIRNREVELLEKNRRLNEVSAELQQQLAENIRYQSDLLLAARRTENILHGIAEGFFAFDQQGMVTYFNEHAEALLGHKALDMIGHDLWQTLSEATGSVFHVKLEEARRSGQPIAFTALYEPDGHWHEVRCYPFDEGVAVFIRDITEARAAEDRVMRAQEFYLKIFEESPSLIWRSDALGGCNYFNKSWLEFTGSTLEESRGDGWFQAVHRDDAVRCQEIWARSLQGREPFSMEYRLRYHDGSYRWVIDYGRPFNDMDEVYAGFVGTCYDITLRKQLEEQLLHAQRMESLGTLAGGVAHDFNNILTVIIGCSEMAQQTIQENPTAIRFIGQVLEAAHRAAGLTRNLLAFSRKQVIETSVVNLNQIVVGMEKMLSRIMPENINMTFELAEDALTILADAGQLEQVLINLVVNARDAMPNGGRLRVRTRSAMVMPGRKDGVEETDTPCAVLDVVDNGTGMDRQTIERIFDPFYTTKEVGKGTGLGLSMVYGIINQHRGYIDVNSEPGLGATFSIYIPLTAEAAIQRSTGGPAQHSRGDETILVAEDDSFVCDANRAILEYAGYRVITAQNGKEAIDRFLEHDVDLILMDVIMPIMNGMEAYKRINEIRPDMSIIFTSGYTAEILEREGISGDDVHLLVKPVPPEALLRAVRDRLDLVAGRSGRKR